MPVSVGEDIFSTLIAVGLISLFVTALAHFYIRQEGNLAYSEDFRLTLEVAERLRNDVLSWSREGTCPGLVSPSAFEFRLDKFSELLFKQGIGLRVEIRSLDGKLLLSHGSALREPRCSVSLPITLGHTAGRVELGELIVQTWGI